MRPVYRPHFLLDLNRALSFLIIEFTLKTDSIAILFKMHAVKTISYISDGIDIQPFLYWTHFIIC